MQNNSTHNSDLYIDRTDDQTNNMDQSVLKITESEKNIIRHIGNGDTNTQIANKLLISKEKIETVLTDLLSKTNTGNLAHLMMYVSVNKVIDY